MNRSDNEGVSLFVFVVMLLASMSSCKQDEGPEVKADAVPAGARSLSVVLRPQETRSWCWAASGQMVMEFLRQGSIFPQCEQAKHSFTETSCPCRQCEPNGRVISPPCVKGGFPDFAYYKFGFECTKDRALEWQDLKREIVDEGRPVAFSWHWRRGGGHMMVAVGAEQRDGQNWVEIIDPFFRCTCNGLRREITYEEFVAASDGSHSHWSDFYEIKDDRFAVDRDCRRTLGHPPESGDDFDEREKETPEQVAYVFLNKIEASQKGRLMFQLPGADLPDLSLGSRLRQFAVGLEPLKGYEPSTNPRVLLEKTSLITFPVDFGSEAVGVIDVRKKGRDWKVVSFSGAGVLKELFDLRDQLTPKVDTEVFEVLIPALNLVFLGYKQARDIKLVPICDEQELGLKKGEGRPAREIFMLIQTRAREHNGFPT